MMAESKEERCDIRVWSPDCRHSVGNTGEVSYLCSPCEKTPNRNHEVIHETMPPYLSGDYNNLS